MKGFNRKWIVMAVLCTLAACASPIRISNREAAPGFSLNQYKTFSFLEEQNSTDSSPAEYNEYVQLLKREIANQLQAKGLQQTEQNPDLLVNIGLSVADKTQTRETRFGQDGPFYTGQRRYTWKSQEVEIGKFQEGSVSVDLVDRTNNTLVWKADAVSVIPNKREKIEERIAEGVQKLFEEIQ